MTCIVAFNTVAHEGKNSSNQSLWKAIITRCFDQGWEKSTFGGVKEPEIGFFGPALGQLTSAGNGPKTS